MKLLLVFSFMFVRKSETFILCSTRPVDTAAQATSWQHGLQWLTRTVMTSGLLVRFSPMGRGMLGT